MNLTGQKRKFYIMIDLEQQLQNLTNIKLDFLLMLNLTYFCTRL